MSLLHSIKRNSEHRDMQFQLFNRYSLITAILGLVFATINAINLRPIINIIFGIIVFLICITSYFLAKNPRKYILARFIFHCFFTFFFIPLGYLTSPGSSSAILYLVLLVMFISTSIAVHKIEYLFPILMLVETLILLRSELWFPDWYYQYNNPVYRINDLSLNFIVVALSIIFISAFMIQHIKKYNDQLYKISITDSLTGLYNRRYFFDFAEAEYNRSLRQKITFSVVFIDLNHFKAINDHFGHLRGDKVLKDIATLIMNNIRSYDIAARYGGDEFIIILPNTPIAQAKEQIKRLESHFQSYSQEYINLNFSVGLGYADSSEKTLEEIINIADQNLYKHKRTKKQTLD